ncbi:MAG TPA: DsbC family protein, partial [Stenotrophobium sp.]|nr:DsbC family protein [Stenotrophobium sp.]
AGAAAPAAASSPAEPAPATARSAADSTPEVNLADLHAKLQKMLNAKDFTVRKSPVPGIYEIRSGMNFGYVTGDGQYMIEGDLVRLTTGEQITEKQRGEARLAALAKIGTQNMIIYSPPNPKHTVTVFTDVDCGYCRMLHSQIAQYNAKGIAIRYVSFPRTGPNTESFRKAEVVWCSADRKEALTKAKLGDPMKGDSSCKNPVMEEYMAGVSLGVRGTPSLILDDGEMIPGYQPPDQLAQTLSEHDKSGVASNSQAAVAATQG